MEPDEILDQDGIPIDAVVVDLEPGMPEGKKDRENFSDWSDEKAARVHYEALGRLLDEEIYTKEHLKQGYRIASGLAEISEYDQV